MNLPSPPTPQWLSEPPYSSYPTVVIWTSLLLLPHSGYLNLPTPPTPQWLSEFWTSLIHLLTPPSYSSYTTVVMYSWERFLFFKLSIFLRSLMLLRLKSVKWRVIMQSPPYNDKLSWTWNWNLYDPLVIWFFSNVWKNPDRSG